jgi:HK97 family phage portal protein
MKVRKIEMQSDNQKEDKSVSKPQSSNSNQEKNIKGGLAGLLDFHSGHDSRDLAQREALEAFHHSPPLRTVVGTIMQKTGEIDYQWDNDIEPETFDLSRPAPTQSFTKSDFFSLLTGYLKLTGEVYILKVDASQFNLIPIPPHLVQDERAENGVYRIENVQIPALDNEWREEDMIIIRDHDLRDPYTEGKGVAQTVGYDVDIDEAASEHTANHLENNARPDLLATINGASKEEIEKFEDSMKQKHGGPSGSGKIQGFRGAEVDIETLQSSFSDLGLNELRRFSADTIRHLFGVPPEIIGKSEDSNRATIESAEYLFNKMTIKPIVNRIVQAINSQFCRQNLGNVEITYPEIVPENVEKQLKVMKAFPGAFGEDEKRALAGYEPRSQNEDPDQNLEE